MTDLNDVHLDALVEKDGVASSAMDVWANYLVQSDSSDESSQLSKGWCIPATLLAGMHALQYAH